MEFNPQELIQTVADLYRDSDERVEAILNKIWELINEETI